jgi:hypothetical protein
MSKIITFIEYAVEMHDIDAASTTLGKVWVNEKHEDHHHAAEMIAKKQYDYLFGSNTVEYACEEPTGLKMIRTITDEVVGESSYKEEDFFKIGD